MLIRSYFRQFLPAEINFFVSFSGVYFSYHQYDFYSKNPVDRYNLQPNLKSLISSYFVEARTWLYILIAVAVVLTVILLLILVFRKRIVIAIALIKEGSK